VVLQPDFRRRSTPLRNTSAARPELLQYGIKNRLLRRHEAFEMNGHLKVSSLGCRPRRGDTIAASAISIQTGA
jgi:hypothetical protein